MARGADSTIENLRGHKAYQYSADDELRRLMGGPTKPFNLFAAKQTQSCRPCPTPAPAPTPASVPDRQKSKEG